MEGKILVCVNWNGICGRGLDSCDSVVDSCKSFPVPLQMGRRSTQYAEHMSGCCILQQHFDYRTPYDTNTTRGYCGANLRTAGWRIVCVCVCIYIYSCLDLDEWHVVRVSTELEHSNEVNISAGTRNTRLMNLCVLKNLNVHARNILALWPWWLTDE